MADLSLQLRVRELMPSEHERDTLFEALRRYQSGQDLHKLLSTLCFLLNDPSKLELYDAMRPLILLRHQLLYSLRVPGTPGLKLRTVRLQRRTGENLGFCVKGGYEHGVGIFVTDVTPGSQADRQGLTVGDEIVRVNGFTISEAIHDDVLNLIRMREDIILKVTYIGMVPVKDDAGDAVTWEYVQDEEDQDEVKDMLEQQSKDLKVFVDTTGHASFGCGIRSGPRSFPGIFIERVRPESLAEEAGLQTGDQIVEVNETSFRKISHKEAVLALKSSRQLNLVIRKKTGMRLFGEIISTVPDARTNGGGQEVSTPTPAPASPSPPPVRVKAPDPPVPAAVSPALDKRSDGRSWLSETQMIEQQLNMSSLGSQNTSSLGEQPYTSSYSSKSSMSSAFNTSVDVHNRADPPVQREIPTSMSAQSPMSGAQAYLEERKLKTDHRNELDLLSAREDFQWTDKLPASVYSKFDVDDLDGRVLKSLSYPKSQELDVEVEGGVGSPLAGKIMVAMVFDGGVAQRSGKIRVGDQLMMVNGQSLVGVTAAEAERLLQGSDSGAQVELIYCESTLLNDEDSVTYF
ncbi:harmonin isoform X2 [Aplysia californica]|uniref:Harmonin isoform X2 n=1 Tax=Aplysia californica TaxID=6500 RepID=A0ABM1ABL1_APLCA|nr:harmonin isoform X2 [Aplysia californica]